MTISQLLGHLELSPLVEMCTRVLPWLYLKHIKIGEELLVWHWFLWWHFLHIVRKSFVSAQKENLLQSAQNTDVFFTIGAQQWLLAHKCSNSLSPSRWRWILFVWAGLCQQQGVDASDEVMYTRQVQLHAARMCAAHTTKTSAKNESKLFNVWRMTSCLLFLSSGE